MNNLRFWILLLASWIVFSSPVVAEPDEFDWRVFDAVIKQHVSGRQLHGIQTRVVAYEALLGDDQFLEIANQLKLYDPGELGREQKLAFYINAYNYFAINTVLANWPLESIRDVGSFFSPVWGKKTGYINNKAVTLEEIEHEILRKMGEPRIHFAIVCCSNSCPDLRGEVFTAADLEVQLQDQVQKFVDNQGKGATVFEDELLVSKIFDWFEEDFEQDGGVIAFISSYAPQYAKYKSYDTLHYDWRLNNLAEATGVVE